jgi:hypothetical protein
VVTIKPCYGLSQWVRPWRALGAACAVIVFASLNARGGLSDNTHLNDTGIAAAATLISNAMRASGAPF